MRRGAAGQMIQRGGRGFELFESTLLIVVLCVLAIRATYLESPHGGLANPPQFLTNAAFSVIISGVLIFAAAAWFVAAFCRGTVVYRFSGIELGLALFVAAGAVSVGAASNKRAAINDVVTLAAPMAASIMLVQVLARKDRVVTVLFVVFALGLVTATQCVDQRLAGSADMIADYERDPQRHLEVIGAEAGSFEQMMYEHRLYGKDIRGFLTTSNSTASLLLLAAFAATGFAVDCVMGRRDRSPDALAACSILLAAILWAVFVMVKSRGGLGAAAVGAGMFAAAIALPRLLRRFRVPILVLCIAAVAAVSAGMIAYGRTHETLPGGASMLVRWQYWEAAVSMYAEKPLTGVGGGNFSVYYPHYKIAAAPETVNDPHNFVLSLLSQYGPLGLVGFLAAFGVVLGRSVSGQGAQDRGEAEAISDGHPKRLGIAAAAVIVPAMLVVRPILMAAELGDSPGEIASVAVVLYFVPAAAFSAVFILLLLSARGGASMRRAHGRGFAAGIFCGIAAAAIHNMIDFAIFEPGVLTLFWVSTACLFAVDWQRKGRLAASFVPSRRLRAAAIGGSLIVVVAVSAGSLMPTIAAGRLTQRAMNDVWGTWEMLERATAADVLSPTAASAAGTAYLRQSAEGIERGTRSLERAADCFREAIARDQANFRHYEMLGNVHELTAARLSGERRREFVEASLAAYTEAVRRYPGSDRINMKAAQTAESLGYREAAAEHYRRVIEIEDAYRRQFAVMYPGRELFSRLGEENYQLAKARLAELSER